MCYAGHDVGAVDLGEGLDAVTGANCSAVCKDDPACKFWTLNLDTKFCNLKSSDAGREENNCISGWKPCN